MNIASRIEASPLASEAASVPAGALTARWLDAGQLADLPGAQWDRLSAHSRTENPFYDRRQVLAALATIDRHKPLRALAILAGERLVGLFLFQPRSKVPTPFAVANSLANNYLLAGTPLVDRDLTEAVMGQFVDMVRRGEAPEAWVFDDVDRDSAVFTSLRAAATMHGLHWAEANPYERAFLTRIEGGLAAHLSQVLSKNRLKDVRRTMRRLGEAGRIELEHVEDGERLAARLEDFLRLEHSGWKGAMGTSFLAHAADADFARRAYGTGLAAMDSLLLDGRPIAMKLSIRTGGTAFTPKIAYDESYRKLGPGMALEYLLIEAFYGDGEIEAVDAAATAEGHSALNFFNDHKAMATIILGRRGWQVWLLARLHAGREALKQKVLAARDRWRVRRRAPEAAQPPDAS